MVLGVGLPSSGGGGDGDGDACLEPAGLKPRPRNGLVLPVGEVALLPSISPIMANDWFFLRFVPGVNL